MAELRIGCLVMAAGSGSRFGRNKLEAVVDGKSLLRRSLEAVPAEEFAQVTVVTQYDAAAALAEEFGFTVVRNDRPEDGLSRTVHLGTEALAAVGDTGSLNFLINGFCMGICSGFAIPIAQAFGAKDETEMRRYVMHSVYLCAVISVLMGLLTGFFAPQLLQMLDTPEDILPLSVAYIQPVFFAIPVTVLYNMCGGVMRSLGDSKTPVIAITIAALLNIVLDYTFILAFHMGVEGAAWATVISQLISGLWCLLVIRKRFTILKMQPEDKRIRAPFVRRLLAMGIPFGLQYSITAIGSLTVTYAVNGIGTIAVAAVTAGGKLSMFFCCVFDALAATMATFAGQNVGAKRLDRINQGLKASSIIGCVYCVLAFVAIYFFGKPLVGLFISQDSADRQLVIDMAQQFLIINSVLYIPLLFVNIVRFSIQGLGYTMIAMIAGLMELVGRAVVAMLFVPSLGYDAACFANPVAWIMADLFLFPCYFTCIRKLQKRLYPEKAAASSK